MISTQQTIIRIIILLVIAFGVFILSTQFNIHNLLLAKKKLEIRESYEDYVSRFDNVTETKEVIHKYADLQGRWDVEIFAFKKNEIAFRSNYKYLFEKSANICKITKYQDIFKHAIILRGGLPIPPEFLICSTTKEYFIKLIDINFINSVDGNITKIDDLKKDVDRLCTLKVFTDNNIIYYCTTYKGSKKHPHNYAVIMNKNLVTIK